MARPSTNLGMVAMGSYYNPEQVSGYNNQNATSGYLNPDGTINTNFSGRNYDAINRRGDKYYGEKLQAALIRGQYEDFMNRYQPYAQAQMDRVLNPQLLNEQLAASSTATTEGLRNIQGQRSRRLGRYGISAPVNPNQSIQDASTRVAVQNETRARFMDRQNKIITGTQGALSTVAAAAGGYGG